MNIGFFTDTYKPQINGVVTSIDIFKEELEKRGHRVFIFAPMFKGEKKRSRRVFRFNSVALPFQSLKEQRLIFPYSRILNKLQKLNLDVIHAQTPFSMGLLAAYISKKNNIPLVHTYHTLFTEYLHYVHLNQENFENFVIWASRNYCNQCDLVISPSDKIKEELEFYHIIPPIETIPTGIDLTTIQNEKETTENIKIKYNIPKHKKILVCVGRLGKEKSFDFIIRALQIIVKKEPNTHLLIIGDGPEKSNLESLTFDCKLTDNITFTGYVKRETVFDILKLSDLFVFASTSETQGLVILEAMATGTPVVAVDAMGISDVIGNNIGGFLAENDLMDFSSKVIKLLTDASLIEEKKQEAIIRAGELSSEKMTSKLIKCYNEVINKHKQLGVTR